MQHASVPQPAATTSTESLSPSLREDGVGISGPACEIKFLLSEELAREVEARLLTTLLPDPHSDPALGGMYAITSLQCDGADFPVFFRDARMDSCKYRVRRYGDAEGVFFERKRSKNGKVRKLRVAGSTADLASLAGVESDSLAHAWFVREVRGFELAPVCRVRYLRRALFGVCDEGALRVTFDRSIRGALASAWSMDPCGVERPLLDGRVVCEFKFHVGMPSPLKAVVSDFKLEPTGISKYRTCVRAFAAELGVDLSREGGVGGGASTGVRAGEEHA